MITKKRSGIVYKIKGKDKQVRRLYGKQDVCWSRKLTENFQENKEMFWREMKMIRKGIWGKEERVKIEDGIMLVEKEGSRE